MFQPAIWQAHAHLLHHLGERHDLYCCESQGTKLLVGIEETRPHSCRNNPAKQRARKTSRGPAIIVRDLQDLLTPRVRRCAVALRDSNFEFRRLRRRFCCWDVLLRQVQLGGKGGSKCELLAERMDRLCTTVVRTILPEVRCELLGNVALQWSAP